MLKTGIYDPRRRPMFAIRHAMVATACVMVLTAALSLTASAAEYRPPGVAGHGGSDDEGGQHGQGQPPRG
jgi:hypothetical protein